MGRYVQRADMEDDWGAAAIAKWFDKDNDADPVKIQRRIDAAIARAENKIDNRFRGGEYAVPLSPADDTVKGWASSLAAYDGYKNQAGLRDVETSGDASANNHAGKMTGIEARVMRDIDTYLDRSAEGPWMKQTSGTFTSAPAVILPGTGRPRRRFGY